MTPRENLLSLFRRQGYAFAPVEFSICPSLLETYRAVTGSVEEPEEYFAFSTRAVHGLVSSPREVDWLAYYPDGLKAGAWIDPDWGIAHEPGSAAAKHMTYMRHPMAHLDSLEQLQAYPFPDFTRAASAHIAAQAEAIHQRGLAVVAHLEMTVWETAWYLRSMEELMMDMLAEDEKATFLLDTITESACVRAVALAQGGVDILRLGDDIGMQSRLMMSQELYRDWLKPRLARVIRAAKAVNPALLVQYHSCGYVQPLIGDLIDAGIDILNPVQPECMDFAEIHAAFGDRVSFHGTVGTQTTMPFGTPAEVQAVVHRHLAIAGAPGGLLCCPTHLLEPEVPWENIVAYVAACREFTTAGG